MRAAAAILLAALAVAPSPVLALDTQGFVAAFAATCVPQRLSFEGTKAEALADGWTAVPQTHHPELDAMMQKTAALLAEDDPDIEMTVSYEGEIYARDVDGTALYLVVSRTVAEAPDLDPFIQIGCYLYDFAAIAPPDAAAVTALIGKPVAQTFADEGMTASIWGPPCPMPRTGDTYLTFIAEGSPHAERTGYTGLLLKFATSEPDPGEVVPETYCTQGEAQ